MKTKPQEKAKDLVSKFGHDLALKVVTEITIAMETYDDRNDTFELQNMEGDFRYWDQVNIELQHLRQQQDEKQSPSAVEQLALQLTYKTEFGRYIVDNTDDVTDAVNRAKAMEEHQQIKAQLAILCDFQRTLDGNDTKENSVWYRVNELKSGLISQLPAIDSDGGANGPQGTEGPAGVQTADEKAEQKTLKQRLSALEQKVEQLSQPKKFAQGDTFSNHIDVMMRNEEEIAHIIKKWKNSEMGRRLELVPASYSEAEVLQLLLKLQTAQPYNNLYDWFQQNKKQ